MSTQPALSVRRFMADSMNKPSPDLISWSLVILSLEDIVPSQDRRIVRCLSLFLSFHLGTVVSKVIFLGSYLWSMHVPKWSPYQNIQYYTIPYQIPWIETYSRMMFALSTMVRIFVYFLVFPEIIDFLSCEHFNVSSSNNARCSWIWVKYLNCSPLTGSMHLQEMC